MKIRVALLLIAFAWVSPIQAEEPRTFCGKTLREWVHALDSKSPAEVRQAVVTLGYFGPEAKAAVPVLVELLRANRFEPDVIETLGRIGPDASASPLILARFRSEECFACQPGTILCSGHGYSPYALSRIGQPAVPSLIAILNDPKSGHLPCAAVILGQIGPDAKDAVPALLKIVLHEPTDWCIRFQAITAIGRIGPEARDAVPSISRLLEDELHRKDIGFGNRHELADALTRIGQPPIRKLLSLSHFDACNELSRLGSMAREAIPELTKDLTDDCPIVRTNAASALAQIDPTIEEAIPPLIEALNSDVEDYWGLPDALARFGPKAKDALPSLIREFEKDPEDWEVLVPLTMIDPEGTACIPSLIAGLKQENSWVVSSAAECLSLIGKMAKAALPALRTAIFRTNYGQSNVNPPISALKALVRIDPESRETMATLCQALKHRTEIVGIEGIVDKENEPYFDYSAAEAAARLLGFYGPKAKSAAPTLIESLQDYLETQKTRKTQPYTIACEFVYALGRIGASTKDAIPPLRRIARDSLTSPRSDRRDLFNYSPIVRAAAIGLVSIDPEIRRVVEGGVLPSLDSESTAALLGALGRPSLEAKLILRRDMECIEEQIRESPNWTQIPIQLEWRFERLSRFGFASRPAIPKLKEWQTHPNPWIRLWTREAIDRIP